jgi:hypothetical protein
LRRVLSFSPVPSESKDFKIDAFITAQRSPLQKLQKT